MIINKELKNYSWTFKDNKLILTGFHIDRYGGPGIMDRIELDKIRTFSLFRFLVRVSQKLSSKRRKT